MNVNEYAPVILAAFAAIALFTLLGIQIWTGRKRIRTEASFRRLFYASLFFEDPEKASPFSKENLLNIF